MYSVATTPASDTQTKLRHRHPSCPSCVLASAPKHLSHYSCPLNKSALNKSSAPTTPVMLIMHNKSAQSPPCHIPSCPSLNNGQNSHSTSHALCVCSNVPSSHQSSLKHSTRAKNTRSSLCPEQVLTTRVKSITSSRQD